MPHLGNPPYCLHGKPVEFGPQTTANYLADYLEREKGVKPIWIFFQDNKMTSNLYII